MSFTFALGWWLAPALITVAAFTWSMRHQDHSPSGDYGRILQGIGNAVVHGVALIIAMFAWLIWALLS